MVSKIAVSNLALAILVAFVSPLSQATLKWKIREGSAVSPTLLLDARFDSAKDACDAWAPGANEWGSHNIPEWKWVKYWELTNTATGTDFEDPASGFRCESYFRDERPRYVGGGVQYTVYRGWVTIADPVCSEGKELDKAGKMCRNIDSENTGSPPPPADSGNMGSPPEEACVGNPINIAVGNKFQRETDYSSNTVNGLSFSRYYNSIDGVWRHNYSAYLRFSTPKVTLVNADGRTTNFNLQGEEAIPERRNETATLVYKDYSWVYTSPDGQRSSFDPANGRLVEQFSPQRGKAILSYNNGYVKVTDQNGQSLSFSEDSRHQPLTFKTSDFNITYNYNTNNNLIKMVKTRGKQIGTRIFHYEDARNTSLLTGITDERGVRFATWTYDDKKRAISSQHSGGAGRTQVAYADDGSSIVTNELGKQTTYKYVEIDGSKRVAEIVGEPSPNCPASNSKYSYDENGRLLNKVDAKGLVTTYEYNSRGFETKRIEAVGTSVQRITTTKWHPKFSLPVEITNDLQSTRYSYDSEGRPIGEVQSPNTVPVGPSPGSPITLPPRVD